MHQEIVFRNHLSFSTELAFNNNIEFPYTMAHMEKVLPLVVFLFLMSSFISDAYGQAPPALGSAQIEMQDNSTNKTSLESNNTILLSPFTEPGPIATGPSQLEVRDNSTNTTAPMPGTTSPPMPGQSALEREDGCEPSYPGICIEPYPPDLNCGDISYRNIRVLPPDPHG